MKSEFSLKNCKSILKQNWNDRDTYVEVKWMQQQLYNLSLEVKDKCVSENKTEAKAQTKFILNYNWKESLQSLVYFFIYVSVKILIN